MKKEFIPYEQALALKELEFDEPCFGFYNSTGVLINDYRVTKDKLVHCNSSTNCVSPLYQQAFRWFREKYKLHSRVFFDGVKELEESDEERYNFDIVEQWTIGKDYFDYSYGFKHLHSSRGIYMSYEEAELECLKKLISIVKEIKNK